MKMKYMRVKVITIPFLTLLILVSTITGCAPVNSQETIDIIKDYGDTVQIEVIERKDHPNIHLGDKDYRVDTPDNEETPEIIDGFKVEEGLGTEEVVVPIDTISPTPDIWDTTMENWGASTPAPSETPAPTPAQLFTEVSVIKYTNTSANLRDTYSTTGKKLTTLPLNTEINVIGTGIPDTEAAGWSKILFNGKEAYISSSLLSDYKIEIQQPVQTQKPAQQPETVLPKDTTPTQQPVQQKPSGLQDVPQEILDALEASGSKPSQISSEDPNPQGPVVVTNTELILPD